MKNIITEYEMMPDLVVEAKQKTVFPESLHFRARALKLDAPTANGRIYKTSLIEREIKRLMDSPTSVFGASFHPEKTAEIPDVSHIIRKLEVGKDGYLWAEGEILDTQRGRDLKAIIAANGRVGLSLRGTGRADEKTGLIDEESYRLHSIDAVLRPASEGAHLSKENMFESIQFEREADVNAEQELCAKINEAIEAELNKPANKKIRNLIEAELKGKAIEAVELVEERVDKAREAVQFILNEALRQKIVETAGIDSGLGVVKNDDAKPPVNERLVAQMAKEARLSGSPKTRAEIIESLNRKK